MLDIPYEKQINRTNEYLCGAAALGMVYQSFGMSIEQEAIWESIRETEPSTRSDSGRFVAKTHQLVRHAVGQDYDALAVRVRDPERTLATWTCDDSLRVILNHRTRMTSPKGHFTVLVGADTTGVVIHDPAEGPSRRLDWEKLVELWERKPKAGEITGRIAVVISPFDRDIGTSRDSQRCRTCGVPTPHSIRCPRCKLTIPFRPIAGLGCLSKRCPARCWETIFCPHCDAKALF
jgi:ABC-type bacteriocin/lantibiotic exporter with double-glycine peptidase domain